MWKLAFDYPHGLRILPPEIEAPIPFALSYYGSGRHHNSLVRTVAAKDAQAGGPPQDTKSAAPPKVGRSSSSTVVSPRMQSLPLHQSERSHHASLAWPEGTKGLIHLSRHGRPSIMRPRGGAIQPCCHGVAPEKGEKVRLHTGPTAAAWPRERRSKTLYLKSSIAPEGMTRSDSFQR